ncbi:MULTISPECIES: ABC-2 transporter permease [Romboutsia]|uniref:ABC-2 family transporter protein n=1 Tax=Romboutsia hominis TaxID=1507512 RepID=A0A2P2BRC3_9FIRM|nr:MULTISPECIES: ABC-2 transporter permease [Romboutsia]MCH1960246.1 ABC-2 transporter permease [Romboutsia hominis]MCH1969319.1 ABC-2 transporter permease [Romboutsia hominis]MDB8791610.1 ABC-2 transporter permease [Romboutsia sp. 1001216sp1]MDB8801413.1 ABC-2 transporter permease [Romboutsia sp. 1001216sp1]MDB8804988.1 ABC-2 transporter permease [Romboutsia sp. 1001216sp1]
MNNIMNLTKMSLINFKAILKQVGIIIIMWLFVSAINPSFIGALSSMITIVGVPQLMSYEDVSGIDNLIGVIPVKRSEYVISRYVIGIITMISSMLIVSVIYHIIEVDINLDLLLTTVILSSTLIISMLIPTMIKYGAIKGKFITMAITLATIFCSMPIVDILQNPSKQLKNIIDYINNINPLIVSIIISILTILISMIISIKIYDKKEFK